MGYDFEHVFRQPMALEGSSMIEIPLYAATAPRLMMPRRFDERCAFTISLMLILNSPTSPMPDMGRLSPPAESQRRGPAT